MSGEEWWYALGSERQGPVSRDQLVTLIASGVVTATTYVWTARLGDWQPAGQSELAPFFASRGPSPFAGPGPASYQPGYGLDQVQVRTFGEAVRVCLSKYVTFSGRANRPEFWWFFVFGLLATIVASALDYTLLGRGSSILSTLTSLGLLLPQLAVSVRRLHDTDRSGWWYLLIFLPLIGIIVLLVFWAKRGTPGPNRFG